MENMPEAGDTKQQYCATCKCETTWEYTVIQMPDGVFGLQNFFNEEANLVKFWRCTNHTDGWGNTLERFKERD
jgi:hypothetical protein